MLDNQLDFIYKRRSIRKFLDRPVEDSLIEKLLSAAMSAPSAMNMQPWNFIVVRDKVILSELRKTSPFTRILAPCAIVVCSNLEAIKFRLLQSAWPQDCSAATENLLLAATALGLGSVWCGVHTYQRFETKVIETLCLPTKVVPFAIVYVGYSAEEKPARTQYDVAKVFRESFGRKWSD